MRISEGFPIEEKVAVQSTHYLLSLAAQFDSARLGHDSTTVNSCFFSVGAVLYFVLMPSAGSGDG